MKRVILGMSGGVDSSVAAVLLKEKGYIVHGITLQLWRDMPQKAIEDAKAVADNVGITWELIHGEHQFEDHVLCHFANSYEQGKTPNPCVECNRHVKLYKLFELMTKMGYDGVATGHYARILMTDEGPGLFKAVDSKKDQSYFLYGIHRSWLDKLVFPLGDMLKEDIRKLAKEKGLPIYDKPDSEDLCFIAEGDYKKYLGNIGLTGRPGDFIDESGAVVGRHKGIINYTVGQRKGLGLALGRKIFVTELDAQRNVVRVGTEELLYHREVLIKDANWLKIPDPSMNLEGRARYGAKNAPLFYSEEKKKNIVRFVEPQRALTPGQSLVIYEGEQVVGGGIITKVKKSSNDK